LAHKGPFTGEGHVGLYEILTTSWHAQLAVNLALFGSLSIIVAFALQMMGHIKLHYMLEQPASTVRPHFTNIWNVGCVSSSPEILLYVLFHLFVFHKMKI